MAPNINTSEQPGALTSGSARRVITDLVTLKTSALETGDTVTVLEVETPPGGGVPPHTQRYEDETIVVIEGSYTFLIDEQQQHLSKGDVRFISRGLRHGYANAGSGPARMLIHLFPGGIQEQFISEIGDAPERSIWESDLARVVSLAPAYGVEFDTEESSSRNI